jgi:hypothetical protein
MPRVCLDPAPRSMTENISGPIFLTGEGKLDRSWGRPGQADSPRLFPETPSEYLSGRHDPRHDKALSSRNLSPEFAALHGLRSALRARGRSGSCSRRQPSYQFMSGSPMSVHAGGLLVRGNSSGNPAPARTPAREIQEVDPRRREGSPWGEANAACECRFSNTRSAHRNGPQGLAVEFPAKEVKER